MLTNLNRIQIGQHVLIRKGARLEAVDNGDGAKGKIAIGKGTAIQFNFHCGSAESVTIGEDVVIGGNVYITDHDHCFDAPYLSVRRNKKLISSPVVVEDECWLGEGCVVLKGVKIGRRSVVAANAVVTHNVPPFCVVAGVPAKTIRRFGNT